MELPSWFNKAIQERIDEVTAHILYHSEMKQVRKDEKVVFYAMFENENIVQPPTFQAWEDQHHYMHALIQEQLYKQGMKDGIQLVYSLWNKVREM